LIGGVVSVSVPGLAGMLPHIKSGKLRALAVTGAHRSPQLPEVPTLAESGFTGYSAYVWLGLLAPRGTPEPIIERLNRELVAALDTPEVKGYMANASIEALGSTPAEFGAFFRAERDNWARVIKETGAKLD
jgi:tripartite-type tricarboxylate transporter receptor subunit TctC